MPRGGDVLGLAGKLAIAVGPYQHEAIGALDADLPDRLIVSFVQTVGQPEDSGQLIDDLARAAPAGCDSSPAFPAKPRDDSGRSVL